MRDPESKNPVRVHLWFLNMVPAIFLGNLWILLLLEHRCV